MADDVTKGLMEWLTTGKAVTGLVLVSFLAGGGVADQLNEFLGHEPRIAALERWRLQHTDSVTSPRLRQIDRLQTRQDALVDDVSEIKLMLSCIHYEISPCPGAPPPPPARDR